ncbi:hypothetical protein SPRG_17301, partial [Saprolegnia parasitica CBS 223.65]
MWRNTDGRWRLGGHKSRRRLVLFVAATFAYQQALYYAFPALCVVWFCAYPFWLATYILRCGHGRSWATYRARLNHYTSRTIGFLCRIDVHLRNVYERKTIIETDPKRPTTASVCLVLSLMVYFYGWKAWTVKYILELIFFLFTLGWHQIYTPERTTTTPIHTTTDGKYDVSVGTMAAALGIWFGAYVVSLWFTNIINTVTTACTVAVVRDKLSGHDVMLPVQGSSLPAPKPDEGSDAPTVSGISITSKHNDLFCIPVPLEPFVQGHTGLALSIALPPPAIPSPSTVPSPPTLPAIMQPVARPPSQTSDGRLTNINQLTSLDVSPPQVAQYSAPAYRDEDTDEPSIVDIYKPADVKQGVHGRQQGASYDPFDAQDFVTTDPPVSRDFPDPTAWVSPTAYSTTGFFQEVEYGSLSPQASGPFLRSQVERTFTSIDISPRPSLLQPTTLTDRVHFTAYAPSCVSPASSFSHAIWAFLVHQRDEMREEAMADGVAKQLSRDLLLH